MIVEPAKESCVKKPESRVNTEIFCKELRHLAARFNLALVFYSIFESV